MSRYAATLAIAIGLLAVAAAQQTATYKPPGGGGDPQMTDFLGRDFEFFGKSGHFYNIYSDGAHQINMGLIEGNVNGHKGTYMSAYGFSCGNSRVNVTLIGEGDLKVEMWQDKDAEASVLVSGQPMQAIIGDNDNKVSIKMEAFETPGGHTVELKSDAMTMSIRSAPAGAVDSVGVVQPAYLNFEIDMSRSPVGGKAAGIIGDSVNSVPRAGENLKSLSRDTEALNGVVAKMDSKRPKDETFEVTGMFGTDFATNLFTGAAVTKPIGSSRRSLMRADAFAGVQFPLVAFGK